MHGKVARGPNVGAAFRKQQIYFCRPAANALYAGEVSNRLLIIGGQGVERQFARQHELRKRAGIALLLAAQPARSQGVEILRQQLVWRAFWANERFKLVPDRCGGRDAHLLPDNRAQQCRIARFPDALVRVTRHRKRLRYAWFKHRQRIKGGMQLGSRNTHQRATPSNAMDAAATFIPKFTRFCRMFGVLV